MALAAHLARRGTAPRSRQHALGASQRPRRDDHRARLGPPADQRATLPLHHPPRFGQRARANQRRAPGGARAQDPLVRRHHAPGDVAAGVHKVAHSKVALWKANPQGLRQQRVGSEPPSREAAVVRRRVGGANGWLSGSRLRAGGVRRRRQQSTRLQFRTARRSPIVRME